MFCCILFHYILVEGSMKMFCVVSQEVILKKVMAMMICNAGAQKTIVSFGVA